MWKRPEEFECSVPPDMMEPVLATIRNGDDKPPIVRTVFYFNQIDFSKDVDYDIDVEWPLTGFYEFFDFFDDPNWQEVDVVAWMPLPEPAHA